MEAVNLPGSPDLSTLDQIPWIELSHAYGAAIDVPEQIRALVTADKDKRGHLNEMMSKQKWSNRLPLHETCCRNSLIVSRMI